MYLIPQIKYRLGLLLNPKVHKEVYEKMNRYELLTIFPATLTDEQRDNTLSKYTSLIEKDGGKIQVVNKWGIKKFAYPINYKNEGFYILVEFDAEPSLPKTVNDLMNIDEHIVRHLCIRKEIAK